MRQKRTNTISGVLQQDGVLARVPRVEVLVLGLAVRLEALVVVEEAEDGSKDGAGQHEERDAVEDGEHVGVGLLQ